MSPKKKNKNLQAFLKSFHFPPEWRGWLERIPPFAPIALGWSLLVLCVLLLLEFHPIAKMVWHDQPLYLPFRAQGLLWLLGSGILVWGMRGLPVREGPDLDRVQAWTLLAMILGAGAFLRLYRYDLPPAPFWDDWADGIVWGNIVRDKDRFYWMFPTDGREPFLPYVMISLMEILPEAVRDFVIKRFAGCSVDLVAIWLMYRAGKELGSRRAGLWAAALTALGRPTLQLTLTGMRALTLTLAVAFLCFATFRMLRKPVLRYFLLWGFAMAFGVHTYSSFRVFMMALPLLLLPWALGAPRRPAVSPLAGTAVLLSLLPYGGVYLGTVAATFPSFQPLSKGWDHLVGTMGGSFLVLWVPFALALAAVLRTRKKDPSLLAAGWALAVTLSSAMVFPISRTVGFTERLSGLSPFHQNGGVGNTLGFILTQLWGALQAIFFVCPDRNDLVIGYDPFFDILSQGAVFLGLALWLARPDGRKSLLVALGALGSVVYVLSNDHASTKLMASAPPLYLLSGWAVSRLFSGLPSRPRKGSPLWGRWVLAGLLYAAAAFGAFVQFEKLHVQWARKGGVHTDTSVAAQVRAHQADHRVYLVPADWFFGWNAQCVLNEGQRYYILKSNNAVPDEGPGEDLMLFVFGADTKTPPLLKKDFPDALWEKVPLNEELAAHDPNPELIMWRVTLPYRSLGRDPGSLLYLSPAEGPWLRRYYNPVYGWRLSGILREARLVHVSDPIPLEELESKKFKDYNSARLVRTTGTFAVPSRKDMEWRIPFTDPIWVQVDGRTVLKRDRPGGGGGDTFRTRLSPGTHRLEVRVRFVDQNQMPPLLWREKGQEAWSPFP